MGCFSPRSCHDIWGHPRPQTFTPPPGKPAAPLSSLGHPEMTLQTSKCPWGGGLLPQKPVLFKCHLTSKESEAG